MKKILLAFFLLILIFVLAFLSKPKSLLPKNAFLRDIQQIPGMNNTYLAIYIEEGYKFNSWDLSCPGEILGDAIIGKYHLVLIQDGKLVNDLTIPPAYTESETELTYKNYKDGWPMENEVKQKEIIKLLDFKDLTGDRLSYEFLLTTTGGGCGFYDRLVGGYDPAENKAILFSNWMPRFNPNEKGESYYLLECGDHGNMTRFEEKYTFDPTSKSYKKIWEKETPCKS